MSPSDTGTLHAPMKVEFDYTRSLGPVLSKFMTGLVCKQILGGVASDGQVVVPPSEYDASTHEPTSELVPVGDEGVVVSWSWVAHPLADQPFDRPFAFALVLLDGADTPLLHAVDVTAPDQIETGMRVKARWAEHRVGAITDLVFEPFSASNRGPDEEIDAQVAALDNVDPVTGIVVPTRLAYDYASSKEEAKFFRGLAEGRILGQRCPSCHKVYVPPRGACPVDGVPTTDEVELAHQGTVTTFCIVNFQFPGQHIPAPYVSAYVLLDGADIAFLHLILECDAGDVRMGMRVEAVWKPREEWGTTIENIKYFRPTGEPDADYETYRNHL